MLSSLRLPPRRPTEHRACSSITALRPNALICRSSTNVGVDIVLSSGFLAFASHAGFLQAVEESNVQVRGVMGTSSGALVGSMFCAGYSAREIAEEFKRSPPIRRIALSSEPWTGLFSMEPALQDLQKLLPPSFEDLSIKFACGVVGLKGEMSHEIRNSGSLAHAVVASAAIPVMFSPVPIPGSEKGPYIDGGMACRVGLDLWRRHQGSSTCSVVHLIGRSSPFSGNDSVSSSDSGDIEVICSPKSGVSLWDLGDFEDQFESARMRASLQLKTIADRLSSGRLVLPSQHGKIHNSFI